MTNSNFEAILAEIEIAKVEAEKFFGEKQNAQAGRRLRASMQIIAKGCKAVRLDVTNEKEARKAAKA